MVASMVLSTTPILPVSCSRKARCGAVNSCSEASSITAFTWPSYSTGSAITLRARADSRPLLTCTRIVGNGIQQDAAAVGRALAHQAFVQLRSGGVR